jgi:enoyl-CoA hydratase
MGMETLQLDISDGVAEVRLNRPDQRNAMNPAFWREIRNVFEDLDHNPEARVAMITSTGPHFTAGLDLKSFGGIMADGTSGEEGRRRYGLRRTIMDLQDCFTAIERCRIPVLAAVQGGCIGGGVDLTTACDMRYCTEDAYFVIKEIDIGMTADVGTLQRLPKLIADGLVRELAYTGRKMHAAEAKDCGLVNAVFADHEALNAAVRDVALSIAAKSPLAITGTKEMINYAREHTVADGLNHIATWNSGMLVTEDLMEALGAGQQKREAVFKNLDDDKLAS